MIPRAVFGAILLAAACAPFSASVNDGDDNLGGSNPDTRKTDAGVLYAEDAASLLDAGHRPVESTDAGSFWCSKQGEHYECEDFDRDDVWTNWQAAGATAKLKRDTSHSVSAPASLGVDVQHATGSAYIRHKIAAPKRVVLSADLAVERSSTSPGGEIDVIKLVVDQTEYPDYFISLVVRTDGNYVLERYWGSETGGRQPVGPISSAFKRVLLGVDLANGLLSASVDDGTLVTFTIPPVTSTSVEVQLGAPYVQETITATFAVNVDNVVIDRQ